MAFKLAELFVSITGDDRPLSKTLAGVQAALGRIGSKAALLAGGAAMAGVAGLGYGLVKGTMAASDLNETLSKTKAILGDAADAVISEADRMAEKFGTARREYLDSAASFAAVFKGVGKSQAEAAAMGNSLTKLAMDMASFDNTSNAEAMQAISSALRGEMDPIEKFRVFLTADKVAAEALALGLAKSKNEIDETAKKAAIASLIFKGTADAQGDLDRTAAGTANQFRKLSGSLSNTFTTIGGALLPAFDALIGAGNRAVGGLGGLFEANKETIGAWATAAGESVGATIDRLADLYEGASTFLGESGLAGLVSGVVGTAFQWLAGVVASTIDTITFALRNWGDLMSVVGIQVQERFTNLVETVRWFAAAGGQYLDWFTRNWRDLFYDTINFIGHLVKDLGDNIIGLFGEVWDYLSSIGKDPIEFDWKPMLQDFKATAEQLPEIQGPILTSMQDQINEVYDKIGAREVERLQSKAQAAAEATRGLGEGAEKATPGAAGAGGVRRRRNRRPPRSGWRSSPASSRRGSSGRMRPRSRPSCRRRASPNRRRRPRS